MNIFSKFFYNTDDNINANTINAFKGNLTSLVQKYPNLQDNIMGIGSIFMDQGKNPSTMNSFNLPNYVKSAFMQNGTVGAYTPNTHQMIFEIPKDNPNKAFKYFAHELAHSIDYADVNRNGTVADDVGLNQYGSFSASKEFVNALSADLKGLEGKNIAATYPNLANELRYPLQGANSSYLTHHNVRESFALLASHIMTGEDKTSGIAQALPNTYALAQQKIAAA